MYGVVTTKAVEAIRDAAASQEYRRVDALHAPKVVPLGKCRYDVGRYQCSYYWIKQPPFVLYNFDGVLDRGSVVLQIRHHACQVVRVDSNVHCISARRPRRGEGAAVLLYYGLTHRQCNNAVNVIAVGAIAPARVRAGVDMQRPFDHVGPVPERADLLHAVDRRPFKQRLHRVRRPVFRHPYEHRNAG